MSDRLSAHKTVQKHGVTHKHVHYDSSIIKTGLSYIMFTHSLPQVNPSISVIHKIVQIFFGTFSSQVASESVISWLRWEQLYPSSMQN